jgi:TRAP-type C4-dicarboxylate transport system permease small subunit
MSLGSHAYQWLDVFRKTTIVVLFSFVIVSGFTEVICRYVFLKSLGWTEEILRYLNVWIILLGASIAAKRNVHLRVTFFLRFFRPQISKRITQGVYWAIFIFLAVFIFYGTQKTLRNIPQQIQAFPISIAWFYLAIPVSSFYILIDYLLIFIYSKHPFEKPEEDEL